jgi:hypothetical protein
MKAEKVMVRHAQSEGEISTRLLVEGTDVLRC